MSSNGKDGLFEVELLLDGVRVTSQRSPVPATSQSLNWTSAGLISAGPHRLDVRVVDQVVNRTSWDVRIAASVLNVRTGAPQYFLLPNNMTTARLANGQSVSLTFEVAR